jgi:4-amino-4-deoxy-L-arabinose transferase-like glycosyltransferase
MTVDKPPLALWVQALSVKVFGFHPLAMLVPQALMGVATVVLVYDLVRRPFGRAAGFVAGLVLALTPIAVAISRHNNPDALLILCCVAALWFFVRALEDGRTRWIVLAGVAVGLGFEAKMAVAFMVVPGMAVAWLFVAPRGRWAAVRQLFAGGLAMVVVGGAWPLLMALTPAADRPWISGTSDNSIWSLIWGYNGLGRLDGQAGGPGGMAGGGPGGGGGGGVFGGPTGWLRLLDSSMGGQAGWLIGFALVGGIAVLIASRLRRTDIRTGWILAVGGAALTSAVAFSTAKGIFHPYYVSFLAPFVAALVGAGFGQLTRKEIGMMWLAPLAIAGGVVSELIVLHNNPGSFEWLPPVLVVAGMATALVAVAGAGRIRRVALATALAVLLMAPATWAAQTLGHATNGTFPAGGPASAGFGGGGPGGGRFGGGGFGGPPSNGSTQGGTQGFGPGGTTQGTAPGGTTQGTAPGGTTQGTAPGGTTGGGFGGGPFGSNSNLTEALSYVRANGGGTIAVSSQTAASNPIISSGADVAALGGFSGRESEVSVQWLAEAVRDGRIRWVLTGGNGGFGGNDGRVGASTVMAAVEQVGTEVDSVSGLYDLQGQADALQALAS